MTKLALIAVSTLAKEKFPDLEACRKATSIAFGIALSRTLALPSSAVESAEEQWAHSAAGTAQNEISNFNESVVIDVDLALETARSFWLVRYFSAFPRLEVMLGSQGEADFLSKLTGASAFMNNDTAAFVNANQEGMISLINRITIACRVEEAQDKEVDRANY